jgi:hypothetical protein
VIEGPWIEGRRVSGTIKLEGTCGIGIRVRIDGVGKESDMKNVKKSRYFDCFPSY